MYIYIPINAIKSLISEGLNIIYTNFPLLNSSFIIHI